MKKIIKLTESDLRRIVRRVIREQDSLSAEDLPFSPTDIDDPDAGFGYGIKSTVDPKSYLSSKGYTDNSTDTIEFTDKIVNEMGFQIDEKYKYPIDPVFYKEFENGKYRIQVFTETKPFSHKSEVSLFENGQKIAGENFNHKEVKMFPNDPNSGLNIYVSYDEMIESIERMMSKYDLK
jgi:hypothetical protein